MRITGAALETAIALRGFARGDLLYCRLCRRNHTFLYWDAQREDEMHVSVGGGSDLMLTQDIEAWEPQHGL